MKPKQGEANKRKSRSITQGLGIKMHSVAKSKCDFQASQYTQVPKLINLRINT